MACYPLVSGGGDEEAGAAQGAMREMFGPLGVDQQVRQAINTCWMMMPAGKKTVDALETEFRRLVDRALRDLREDAQAFGLAKNS